MENANARSPGRKIGSLVLAGGLSQRMGRDKAMLRPFACQDRTLLAMAFELASIVAAPCHVSCAPGRKYAGYPCIEDRYARTGPAGGLLAGLEDALKNDLDGLLVIPCDMPFLQKDLLGRLVSWHESHVLPVSMFVHLPEGRQEPLVAVYSTAVLPLLEKAINAGNYSLKQIFAEVCACLPIRPEEEKFFLNCNRPQDLQLLGNL